MATTRSKKTDVKWEMVSVPLVKLHLDLENYRHEEVDTEEAAIAQLYTHEKVEALARDIAEQGAISPLDRIGVIPMAGNPGHFIAVEGNRRLCSLLLLNDPDRAPTPEARTLMRQLVKKANLPSKIDVVKFSTKESAKHWIDLRHLGPQDGQGLRAWNTTQKDRAAEDGGPNKLAVAILDRARDGQWAAHTKLPAVTTITRYLKNREVRAALGLGHHRDLVFTHDPVEVDAALQQFLRDATPPANGERAAVHSRSNDAERAAYARALRDRAVSPRTTLSAPTTPAPATPATGRRTGAKNRPDPAARKFVVPAGFVCNVNDRNLRSLFKEMLRTPIEEHEFANTYLLRAFLERVMGLYLKAVDPGYTARDDLALVRRCSEKLDPTGKNTKFKAIRMTVSDQDASHSLHTLGSAVHLAVVKDRRALVAAWDNWEHAVTSMLAAIPTK